MKKQAFELFLIKQPVSFFEHYAEQIAHDKGEIFDPDSIDNDFAGTMSEWMQTRALKNRGIYAICLELNFNV